MSDEQAMVEPHARRYHELVQAAIGVLAAHDRGDREGANRLLTSMGTTDDALAGSFSVASLATQVASSEVGRTPQDFLQELSLQVASRP